VALSFDGDINAVNHIIIVMQENHPEAAVFFSLNDGFVAASGGC
jgi:phospholipase C